VGGGSDGAAGDIAAGAAVSGCGAGIVAELVWSAGIGLRDCAAVKGLGFAASRLPHEGARRYAFHSSTRRSFENGTKVERTSPRNQGSME